MFHILAEHDSISYEPAAQLLVQIFRVIPYLHLKGIVHRDINSENYPYTNRNYQLEVKGGDFGFAAHTATKGEMVDVAYVETLDYPALEMLLRQEYGSEVHMWSIGVMLYTMLSGPYPFGGSTMEERARFIMSGSYKFLDSE